MLEEMREGDPQAVAELWSQVYRELHREVKRPLKPMSRQ